MFLKKLYQNQKRLIKAITDKRTERRPQIIKNRTERLRGDIRGERERKKTRQDKSSKVKTDTKIVPETQLN